VKNCFFELNGEKFVFPKECSYSAPVEAAPMPFV
jgi:hypothetical protein